MRSNKLIFLFPAEDLRLDPGFAPTTTGYDPPSFYSSSNDQQSRIYDSSYREQDLYPGEPSPGYRAQNSYSLYSGNTGLSVDLPSPDSGIGPDQVKDEIRMCSTIVCSQISFMIPWSALSLSDKVKYLENFTFTSILSVNSCLGHFLQNITKFVRHIMAWPVSCSLGLQLHYIIRICRKKTDLSQTFEYKFNTLAASCKIWIFFREICKVYNPELTTPLSWEPFRLVQLAWCWPHCKVLTSSLAG